jgi:hypothetical protein
MIGHDQKAGRLKSRFKAEGLSDVVNPVKRVLPTSATPTATPSMRRRAEADGS